jgi:Choline dehydrogenase and related flavoproteins
MVYQHGSAEDFNRYASHTGDQGWKWDNMKKYVKKVNPCPTLTRNPSLTFATG